MSTSEKTTSRDAQRLATRERLFAAAVAEFKRSGVASADVSAIVAEAGVAHGTFFFHFPTKEHVVAELGQREETRMAGVVDRFLTTPRELSETLAEVIRQTGLLERRIGTPLFKDMVALYFSPGRPELQPWMEHPLITRVIEEFRHAGDQGRIRTDDADAENSGIFFFLGLFALLVTHDRSALRSTVLEQYAAVLLRGLEVR
ncbi:MAG TPA: TetR/AcrR family transcriptional regulator [Microthrixaceae bacterium]|nr:TetR/AcrR family transcriptional regulator [Microthrixaceae bacterium]